MEIEEGTVIVYARTDNGMNTAEGFPLRRNVAIVVGTDVTIEFAKRLVKSRICKIDVQPDAAQLAEAVRVKTAGKAVKEQPASPVAEATPVSEEKE